MPKPFRLSVEVEEIALGAVIRQLNRMPGVIHVGMKPDEDEPKKSPRSPNGHDKPTIQRRLTRFRGGVRGEDFLLKAMASHKTPMKHSDLVAEFVKDGRSGKSASPIIYALRKKRLVSSLGAGKGYALTKKGRDKATESAQ